MTEDAIRAAADLLSSLWTDGGRVRTLPDALRPRTRAEGYAVQACLERRRSATRFGWKVAATSSAGQAHIGVDGPIAGRLFAERVVRSGTMLPFGSNAMRVAEAEFAFRMARPLTPRAKAYTPEEVLQAVGTLHPAIELPDSRYDDFAAVGGPSLIADVACAHWFVLGEATSTAWRTLDLARATVVVSKAGTSVEGSGAEVLGDPRLALTWLVNELSSLGIELAAGQVVTTGTCITPLPIAPGDRICADFGVFGEVRVVLAGADREAIADETRR